MEDEEDELLEAAELDDVPLPEPKAVLDEVLPEPLPEARSAVSVLDDAPNIVLVPLRLTAVVASSVAVVGNGALAYTRSEGMLEVTAVVDAHFPVRPRRGCDKVAWALERTLRKSWWRASRAGWFVKGWATEDVRRKKTDKREKNATSAGDHIVNEREWAETGVGVAREWFWHHCTLTTLSQKGRRSLMWCDIAAQPCVHHPKSVLSEHRRHTGSGGRR